MTTRYELKAWRQSQGGKAYTVRLGSAWVDQKGNIQIDFDGIPCADEKGKTRAFLETPRERTGDTERTAHTAKGYAEERKGNAPADLGDEIPFSPEMR